jgi:hypothetical protein
MEPLLRSNPCGPETWLSKSFGARK